ncbi:MAG: Omp28-related outer membrane protein [Bacteroidaceae bacterium]|nr:Omp28-related outer membrane protein [Bacteroidaceae bacterium]
MKTQLLSFWLLLALGFSTLAQAQVAPPNLPKPEKFIDGKFIKASGEFSPTGKRSRSLIDGAQEPKWLTNLPCDSSIYKFKMYAPDGGSTYWYSTAIFKDLTGRFVGNKVTTIKTYVPAGGFDLSVYIMDNETGETLWSAYVGNGYLSEVMIDVPCDWVIDKPREILVGYSIVYDDGLSEVYLGIVPCFRNYTWLIQSTDPDYTQGKVYNYSNYYMMLKGYTYYFGLPFYLVTEGDAGLKDNGIEINGVSHNRVFMGEKADFTTTFVNYGCTPIKSAQFECRLGENTSVYEHNQPVPFLGSGSFETKISTDETAVRLPLSVTLKSLNGEVPAEEIKEVGSITTVDPKQSPERTVVMEEYTGTWCGWCPRGLVAIDVLSEEYGDKFIPIAIHSGDNMEDASFGGVAGNFSTGSFPSSTINRVITCDPYYGTAGGDMGVDNDVNKIFGRPTEATFSIDDLSISEDLTKINITTSATFNITCAETPYAVSYVLTEDGLTAAQTNYFAVYSSEYASNPYLGHLTKLGQYYKATFDHVGRAVYGTYGVEGSLSGTVTPGETKTHSYEITVPENIKNIHNVHIVAMLVDTYTGEIINASSRKLAEVTGIKSVSGNAAAATIEVGAGSLNISAHNAVATIYTPDGRTVVSRRVDGNIGLHLPAGSYIVRVDDGSNTTVKKVQF